MPVHARARLRRSLPIRPTLVGIFAVPLISLALLWAFAAYTSIANATHAHSYQSIAPRVQPVLTALVQEQSDSYIWLATGRRSPPSSLAAVRATTDSTAAAARNALDTALAQFTPRASAQLDAFYQQLGQLTTVRTEIDNGTISPAVAFNDYNSIVDAAFHFFDTTVQSSDPTLAQDSAGVTDASYALEMAGREAALVGGVIAAGGRVSPGVHTLFASTTAYRQMLTNDALALLGTGLREQYAAANSSAVTVRFAALESKIAGSTSATLPVSPAAWESASTPYLSLAGKTMSGEVTLLDAKAAAYGDQLDQQAYLTGGLGLLAVIASIVLLVWFGHRVGTDLTSLRDSARRMADERMPQVVERLKRGEDVDVAAESPPPEAGLITEIARVSEAFATVQSAAVAAAVQQADLRKQVSRIFLNLSMRSQSLLQRQLTMLDAMEKATADPDELEKLFRLDSLTTRMRRNAEGLIILSGAVPARRWSDPVPVFEVIRAAISEIEDYPRVAILVTPLYSITGGAVSDVVHLLAELIENAAVFSPPTTQIEVTARAVADGVAIEVTDRGLGLTSTELAEINERLAAPRELDAAAGGRLGLFIVGRIAARHGIRVQLGGSDGGGVVASVHLPHVVVVRQPEHRLQPRRAPRAVSAAAVPGASRSPEARRDSLVALQQGWQRGRLDWVNGSGEENSQ
jgi:signal transduction histidine kinase